MPYLLYSEIQELSFRSSACQISWYVTDNKAAIFFLIPCLDEPESGVYIDYKACLSSFAKDPVKCRLPPATGPVIHIDLFRFFPGQPENVAVAPPGPPQAPPSRQASHTIAGHPVANSVLPLAPPGAVRRASSISPVHVYSPSHPNGPALNSASVAAPAYVGSPSQYPGFKPADDGPSNNGSSMHKKRKLGEIDDEHLLSQSNKRASRPSSSHPTATTTNNLRLSAQAPIGNPRVNASSSVHGTNNGHSNGNPTPSRNVNPHSAYPNGHPTGSSTSQLYPNELRRRSGVPMNGGEVPPAPTPPQVIRKVKLVVKPQDKNSNDPPMTQG